MKKKKQFLNGFLGLDETTAGKSRLFMCYTSIGGAKQAYPRNLRGG